MREGDPRKLSLICPECCARNANDARFCTACGVAFRPEPIPTEGVELACPVCDALMPRADGRRHLRLNECTSCGGLWVPGEHFDRAGDARDRARKQRDPSAALAAPPRVKGANPPRSASSTGAARAASVQMLRRNFRRSSGVILDVCREHGTWLDADELEQITGFILSGGTHVAGASKSARRRRAAKPARRPSSRACARSSSVQRQRENAPLSLGMGLLKLIKLLLD